MMKYLTPSPVACPCHYRVTCILTDLEVVSLSTSCVFLGCRVDSRYSLVRDQFRSLRLTRGRCPHDVTDRYLLMVTMDQWSCAVEGCKSRVCLQAFVFADLLDVSSDGGGVMPTPECRTGRGDGLYQVIGLLCVEPCFKILARVGIFHLHLSCLGCWPWMRVSFSQDFWWHLDGSWLLQNKENLPKKLKSENGGEEMNSWQIMCSQLDLWLDPTCGFSRCRPYGVFCLCHVDVALRPMKISQIWGCLACRWPPLLTARFLQSACLGRVSTACSCAWLDPCCTVSWLTHPLFSFSGYPSDTSYPP